MIDRFARLAHSRVLNVSVALAFAVFVAVGYHYGGLRFVEEWGGSVAATISTLALIWKTQAYWVWQIANASLWVGLFFHGNLKILGWLQVGYIVFAVYGAIMWAITRWWKIGYEPKVVRDNIGTVIALTLFAWSIYAYRNMPGYTGTFWWGAEATTVFVGIWANWMDAYRMKFNWVLWSMTNVISVPLFWHNHLYGPFALSFVWQTINFVGYYHWRQVERRARTAKALGDYAALEDDRGLVASEQHAFV